MQKSFKKAIACLLAVLMVAFAMPFSAFAEVGEYEPDVQLQFSSFFDANEQTDPTEKAASSADCFESAGLAAFPIQYNAETGTLKAKAEDINTYNEYWESDTVDEDWVIGEDDIFAVTIRFDDVDIAASGNINIRFSDNLSPAGLGTYTYKDGKKEKTGYIFCGDNTKPATFKNEVAGFRTPIDVFSASSLYAGMNDTLIGDLSCIQEDPFAVDGDGWSDEMMTATLVCSGDYVDVSSIDSANGFFNIEDGTYDSDSGYTYDGKFIVATFVFQYSGEGPIQFALQDPDGSLDPELNGASFFGKKSEGLAKEFATTYAPNGDNAGSMKMTFMGKNENKGGETPHVHDYTAVVTNPTCEDGGYTTYTCACGDSYEADFTDALGHDLGEWKVTTAAVPATCTEDGKTAVETRTCKRNGCDYSETKGGAVVKATGHTPADAVVENEVAATCKAAGSYDEVVYCSVCKAELSRTQKTIAKLAHTPAAAVEENRVEPTEETEGSYDEVVYCSVCGTQISRETKTIPVLEHTHKYTAVVTNPTCETGGYTTYTCACGDSYEADFTDALGHDLGEWKVTTAAVPATCTEDGKTAVETRTCKRNGCDYSETKGGAVVKATGHTPADAVVENEVAATCKAAGSYDEVVYCSVCKAELSRTQKTIAKLAHTPGEWVADAHDDPTCTEGVAYYERQFCTECNTELASRDVTLEAKGHTAAAAVDENVKPATKRTDGTKDVVVYCSVCHAELSRETVVTDKALGVNITIGSNDLGYITADHGRTVDPGVYNRKYGTSFTFTAVPVSGATFVGWEVDGKILSDELEYSTRAIADTTIIPVFAEAEAASHKITVTFYDKYGNNIKQYTNMDVDAYQEAINLEYDSIKAPAYPSYTFKSWDKTKDEILALTESTTIWANYAPVEKEEAVKSAITAADEVTVKLPDGVDKNNIPYDTKVTVSNADAKAWKVNDTIVGYGSSYSFYVGSDVNVEPVFDEVEEAPSVVIVGANLITGSDYKYNIVATRNVPDGYTLVDYGFVYGKNLTDADLDIDNVGNTGSNSNSGQVKVVHAGTKNAGTNEFALNYGITMKNAPITAKAFVIVSKGSQTEEPVYTDMFVVNY